VRVFDGIVHVPLCPVQAALGFSELIATKVYSCSASTAARTTVTLVVGEEEQDKLWLSTRNRSKTTASAMASRAK